MGSHELDDRERKAQVDDERAAKRDDVAVEADHAAEQRDEAAKQRPYTVPHRLTDPTDERRHAVDDRADAARDRARARHDREASRSDRQRAGGDRGAAHDAVSELKGLLYRAEDDDEVVLLLGQAQGMIMAARNATPLQALLDLSVRAAEDGSELGAAAAAIVRETNERNQGRS